MPLTKWNKILIVRTDRIGDVVLTTPMFKALRKTCPVAKISVLLTPLTQDLVLGNPYIDEVIVDDRNDLNRGLIGFLRLARRIRQHNFDVVFILHTKRRYNMACFLAGIPNRIGYQNDKFGFLLTCPVKDDRPEGLKHESEYCLDLLKVFGVKSATADVFIPCHKESEDWAVQWFQTQGLLPGGIIAIHPGASDPTRLWPAQSYARLIDVLSNRYALKIALIGGLETVATATEIIRLSHAPIIDLTAKTTVAQTASFLRRCRLLISSDSGPLHIAAGVGIYVICLFLRNQPGINPTRWRPLGDKAFMLTNKAGEEIILNQKGQVQSGKFDSITVEQVSDLMEQIFAQDNQSLFYW